MLLTGDGRGRLRRGLEAAGNCKGGRRTESPRPRGPKLDCSAGEMLGRGGDVVDWVISALPSRDMDRRNRDDRDLGRGLKASGSAPEGTAGGQLDEKGSDLKESSPGKVGGCEEEPAAFLRLER
jgi:hypothetical protein